MLKATGGYSGFSVRNADESRDFYSKVLGLEVSNQGYGTDVHLPGGAKVFFYPKGDGHEAANYTILNLEVEDVDEAVNQLTQQGVVFEHYEFTDEKGIQRGIASGRGPDQAWFKDPSGNIISVLKDAPQA